LRPAFRRLPRFVLLAYVVLALPFFLVLGAILGAFEHYNNWWDELGNTWTMQD
jgi:hypothetical protein